MQTLHGDAPMQSTGAPLCTLATTMTVSEAQTPCSSSEVSTEEAAADAGATAPTRGAVKCIHPWKVGGHIGCQGGA